MWSSTQPVCRNDGHAEGRQAEEWIILSAVYKSIVY